MNLSKTEKLLAAKKKLKEFQMNKKLQSDGANKRQHNSTESSSPLQNKNFPPEPVSKLQPEEVPQNLGITQNQDITYNTVFSVFKESEAIENHQEILNDHAPEISVFKEDAEARLKVEGIAETIDFPTARKNDLLEMASAVANALTNDSENVDSSLDSDLILRNQFLGSHLEQQKKIVNELHVQISNYCSTIAELESKLATRESEFQAQLAREINPLKEQLQFHAQTTGILIAEKAELTAALSQTQQSVRQSIEGTEELSSKLKASQIRINDLEKEICTTKSTNEELRNSCQQLQNDCDTLEKKFFELRKEKEDLGLEASELKQKLNLKKTELVAVQQELQEKTALLSLSELRIQQMTDASQTEEERHSMISLEQELAHTKEALKLVSSEKEEASKQYQNYVRQLDAQQGKLLDEAKIQKKTIEESETREQSYVQRLSELEQQLQQEKEKAENMVSLQERKEQTENLLRSVDELTLEQERLHIILSEKDSQIEVLTKEVSELRETSNQGAEVSKLATALESEQLGASRAIQQNRQLKEQLTDMENAFVSLSNAKLDLTEQLQAERSIGRKLNAKLNNVETELDEFKEKLNEKDALLLELEKERLQNAQIADHIQHYQAQSHHAYTFQKELEKALITIEGLQREKQELIEMRKSDVQKEVSNETDSPIVNENHLETREEDESLRKYEESVIISEPVRKLEERFKENMERVAELTEEKQKLEHLVLQLQSETETIGEYITLYQKQRAVLQGRAREREQVFRQVLEQRNQQQEQLHKLKMMVSDFLRKEYIHSNGTEDLIEKETDEETCVDTKRKIEEVQESQVEGKNVSELLDLLTEIKDCKDICVFEPNFHPCPWCSGKLITV